ncbi:MAG: uracil-DNA glycosylase [Rubrivivax sp.]|nr:MAG: uracil-DNA glycosylase [Rubrivivax sp.]
MTQRAFDFEPDRPAAPAPVAAQKTDASPLASQLTSADMAAWPVAEDWRPVVDAFLQSAVGRGLQLFLQERLAQGAVIYPPEPFRALALTPLAAVRVVIVGQDPYHGPGQAEGLAFSVAPGVRLPPSLRNIFKEIQRDLGRPIPADGSLVRWARQGVLLLNTSLTVEQGLAASHAKRGWEALTDSLIALASRQAQPMVFLLWGAHAQAKRALIDTGRHLVLTANHPSPLSALRPPEPFIGCGHFGQTERWLAERGETVIF